tara:strand:+ start:758 stop:1087 length:330 start_codon:yes stop_codon:yes gene_type:complete
MLEKIINKVPHPIYILDEENRVLHTFPKSNGMIRLAQKTSLIGSILGIPISQTIFGEPDKLPKYEKNIYYIVSNLVKTALPDRTDLLSPSNIVRNEEGAIIGCLSLDIS